MPPLDGITVLDLTRVLSGPYCTMLLADMGARVIKVEQPGKGDDTRAWGPPFLDGESAYFLSVNRNKESVTLDFKHPDGRALVDRLVDRADVMVENFRPDTLAKLGLDYASLAPAHPRLVYASVSGFGQTGPRRNQPAYAAVVQAGGRQRRTVETVLHRRGPGARRTVRDQPPARGGLRRTAPGPRATLADGEPAPLDCTADRGGDSVRIGSRSAGDVRRSPDRSARDARARRTRDDWLDEGGGPAGQAFGHAGKP